MLRMKTLKLVLSFIFLLIAIYCTMVVISTDDPIYVVLLLFGIAFFAIFKLIKRIKEFYDDSTIQT